MIKHVVFFRFPGLEDKDEFLRELKIQIEELGQKISVLQHIEAGINFSDRDSAYDIALISEFKRSEDLDVYRTHPEHLALVDFIERYKREIAVVDYEN